MDPRILRIKGELSSYLPSASEAALNEAARAWMSFVGSNPTPDNAPEGLRTDFLKDAHEF